MRLWLGSFHFAALIHRKQGGMKMVCFEYEKEAIREAKFALWNEEGVEVLSLDAANGNGKVIYTGQKKLKLVKVKE